MKTAFWIVAIACQVLCVTAQTGRSDRFFPFAATRENYLRQRAFVERLHREYARQSPNENELLGFSNFQSHRARQQGQFLPVDSATADIVRAAQQQIQNLQEDQQRMLIQQGQAQQQMQQQALQQQVVQQQQQILVPQFQPQTEAQAQAVQEQNEEVQRQHQATAEANGQFQNQVMQQSLNQQRQIQSAIQQAQIQEQLQLQQAAQQQRGRGRSEDLGLRPLSRPVRQEPMTEVCLACICQASTSCNLTTQCISGGQYCGPFLISKPYWLDAGSPTLLGDQPSRPGAFEDCTADPVCSAQTVRTYMTKYAKDCNNDGRIDCDDLGRIHLMGAYGCADPSVTQTPFFQRFQQCFTRASKF